MDLLINLGLRGIFVLLGAGAALWILRWFRENWREASERWTVRIAAGMLGLAVFYGAAHVRLLAQRAEIEAGREQYAIFGDPRRTEMRRGEVRGWILDCTGRAERALALYGAGDAGVQREYPLGEGGANFLGGGLGAEERDYTVEALYVHQLREPRSLLERAELHPVGTDLQLTLCRQTTAEADRQLRQSGRQGAVIVQEVETGALLAYAATGGPEDPPLGIKRYSPPGSVFKLALAALWWDHGLPDEIAIPCPAEIQVTPRAVIANFGRIAYGTVSGPTGMLIPSCNTAAVWMALQLRDRIGSDAFVEGYRRMGFETYEERPPTDTIGGFWRTSSDAWTRRMTPSPSRIRISENTGPAEWAQLSIGQGPLDVTVVGISRFVHAIANGGVMIEPTFEAELASRAPLGTRVMSEETALRLLVAMRETVERGTGRAAEEIMRGTGWRMGGKTGTAQVGGRPDNGWFAGVVFSPEGMPRYTVVTFLEGGGPGGGAPTAISARVARQLIEEQGATGATP
jgi:cell division protein FtsI/penicillin-binding protein 2